MSIAVLENISYGKYCYESKNSFGCKKWAVADPARMENWLNGILKINEPTIRVS